MVIYAEHVSPLSAKNSVKENGSAESAESDVDKTSFSEALGNTKQRVITSKYETSALLKLYTYK